MKENSPEQNSLPSPEEEDLIRRSTKKQKGESPSFLPPRTLSSYKDSLVNPEGAWQDHTMSDFIPTEEASEVASDVEDNIDDDIPVILLSKAEKERIHAPWKSALIIKVFGKSIGFKYMDFKIRSLWKPLGDMQCIDLGNDYFLTRFKLEDDYWKVMRGGPWFINQQFLTIRRWSPGFRPSEAKISTTAVWARLPELPIELYDMNILRRIGNQLGYLLKVDARTMDNERGRFARLCVQIDLEQPLTSKIRIGDMVQKIQYEGISAICFECGRVGHRIDTCHYKTAPTPPSPPKAPEPNPPPTPEEDPNIYGKWMIVSRRKSGVRKPLQKNANPPSDTPATSSSSKHRNTKPTTLGPRDGPLEPHKRSVPTSPITIQKDQVSSPKPDQPLPTKHSTSPRTMQIHNHHLVIADPANPVVPETTLTLSSETTTTNTSLIPVKTSVSCPHAGPSSDITSKLHLEVNSPISIDKAPDTILAPNRICYPNINLRGGVI
uniref:CCHC-type domain-containing protein n=1 Tax=Fagus sylvatica TaxID=28930 RepID=A0A2N9F7I4_FAGSY